MSATWRRTWYARTICSLCRQLSLSPFRQLKLYLNLLEKELAIARVQWAQISLHEGAQISEATIAQLQRGSIATGKNGQRKDKRPNIVSTYQSTGNRPAITPGQRPTTSDDVDTQFLPGRPQSRLLEHPPQPSPFVSQATVTAVVQPSLAGGQSNAAAAALINRGNTPFSEAEQPGVLHPPAPPTTPVQVIGPPAQAEPQPMSTA